MILKQFLIFSILAIATLGSAQETQYQLSSHILDVTQGKPATDVTIRLSIQDKNGNWTKIDERKTDENGRITDFLKVEKGSITLVSTN